VVVEIYGRHAQAGTKRPIDAGACGDIAELVAAVVVVEPRRNGRVGPRGTVVALARRRVTGFVGGLREVYVAQDDEVESAVAVVVEKGRTRRPHPIGPGKIDLRKCPVPVVAVKRPAVESRDQ